MDRVTVFGTVGGGPIPPEGTRALLAEQLVEVRFAFTTFKHFALLNLPRAQETNKTINIVKLRLVVVAQLLALKLNQLRY
jgi:hypothetical protein